MATVVSRSVAESNVRRGYVVRGHLARDQYAEHHSTGTAQDLGSNHEPECRHEYEDPAARAVGRVRGKTIRRHWPARPAPSDAAAGRSSGSSLRNPA